MPRLKEAIANVIMDGTRRRYEDIEGEGLMGGVLIDRFVGGARKRARSKSRKAGMLIDRYVGCGSKRRVAKSKSAKRIGGARSDYMDFVKSWHAAHPNYSWAEAVRAASADYRKSAKSAANKVGLGVMAAGARRRRAPAKRGKGVMAAGVRRRRAPAKRGKGVMAAGRTRRVARRR
jgi:hypothetical protein